MISIRSGVLVEVNLPPGSGSGSATPPSGLLGSGLLGRIEATSNAASGDTGAGGAAGACADAAVAASRMARAKPDVERIIVISTFQLLPKHSLHVWRARLSDQGASTLVISVSSAGHSIQTAVAGGTPARST